MRGKRIALIGAAGNVGRALAPALLARGARLVAITRSAERFQPLGGGTVQWAIDLNTGDARLRDALADSDCVVNVVHAKYTSAILAALPGPHVQMVTLGSTRKFTRFPDKKAAAVLDAEKLYNCGVKGVILHPSMIYGGSDNNISRILRIVRWAPFVPMPRGGCSLIQPIHRDDVVRALIACVEHGIDEAPLVIAGAKALSYAEIVRACSEAVGRRVRIISAPFWAVILLARLSQFMPGLPAVTADEVQRLLEDKNFDIAPMRARLGINPCTFEEGLARMLAAGEIAGRNAI